GSAAWRDLGARSEGTVRFQALEVTPTGGAPIELWFDAGTGLLARTRHREGLHVWTTTFSDYRTVDGVTLPFLTVSDRGEPRDRQTLTITEAHLRGPQPAAAWARPATAADRAHFTGGVDRTELPFELINNHIFISAAVDGKPVRMLVDTGGLNLLTPAAGARLGLKAEGKLAAGGAGAQEVDLAMAPAGALTVGAVVLDQPVFYVIDLGALADVEGIDFDGLVGFELFHRFVVRIDYPARKLTLIARDHFQPPAGAAAVPFKLDGRTPIAAGSVDGIAARITIDTGARNSLTTHAPFTREHKLAERYHPRFQAITGWGVGGPTLGYPVRFGEVRLGTVVLRDVAGDLFTGDRGAMADPDVSANLGGGILRRFAVTFDYAARTMYLQDGPERDARDTYDRLGAWLMRDGTALRVGGVTPTGPAERAGMKVDDRILAVADQAAGTRSLADWRTWFRSQAPGTRVRIVVSRGGPREVVDVTLAELLP
ncbi:MAG TPA: aspartyl protease family protein, partial [Kofleriaceae bacterium]|nr:aspartyl protease family protein [Kofleriaceae bacterium]